MKRPTRKDLSNISAYELQAELQRRQQRTRQLMRRHQALIERAKIIGAEIERQGGPRGANELALALLRSGERNKISLAEVLRRVLADKTLSAREATEAVIKTGYRTSSPNFRAIVHRALLTDPKFRRVSRGRYTAK
jgi:PAS domain-containing protein